MGKPGIYDILSLILAGIDPKTGLPSRLLQTSASKDDIKRLLRVKDEQQAVNRYVWYNLPMNMSSQELERLLYYKGQLAFFYMKETGEFYFMPYALDGTIDFYGRYNSIHPVPMSEGTTEDEKRAYRKQLDLLAKKHLDCVYGIKLPDDVELETFENSAVLLHDYTKQLSQTIIPRQLMNDGLLDIMAECIPMMHTNLLGATGVEGIRVTDADQQSNVEDANRSLKHAALTGDKYVPIVGAIEFQELTDGSPIAAQDYMLAMQSLDNFRMSLYGLDNGGVFEKKEHMLGQEQSMNSSNNGMIYQDGLSIRQNFCNIVNSIWGCGIWCEESEQENMMQAAMNDESGMDDGMNGSAGVEANNASVS